MATDNEIIALVTVMETCFVGNTKKTDEEIKVYCAILRDLPSDSLMSAAEELMVTTKFFPAPADWRGVAVRQSNSPLPSALEAWEEVQKCLSQSYGYPVYCSEGAKLRDAATTEDEKYWDAIFALRDHCDKCDKCGTKEREAKFSHPVILKAFQNMGGFKLAESDNIVADRSQFVRMFDGLQEEYKREQVKLLAGATKALSSGLS